MLEHGRTGAIIRRDPIDLGADCQSRRDCAVSRIAHPCLSDEVVANSSSTTPSRVARTAAKSGIRATSIYTDPDAHSQHALCSPFAVNLGSATAYLDGDRIIEVAKQHGCQSVHPGYGFVRSPLRRRRPPTVSPKDVTDHGRDS